MQEPPERGLLSFVDGTKEKRSCNALQDLNNWRRERDSNPRYASAQRFSRLLRSITPAPLRIDIKGFFWSAFSVLHFRTDVFYTLGLIKSFHR